MDSSNYTPHVVRTPAFHSICVFCGSSAGANDAYRESAHELGTLIASRGLRLVYGGSNVGLMAVLANAALAAADRGARGGEVDRSNVGVTTRH